MRTLLLCNDPLHIPGSCRATSLDQALLTRKNIIRYPLKCYSVAVAVSGVEPTVDDSFNQQGGFPMRSTGGHGSALPSFTSDVPCVNGLVVLLLRLSGSKPSWAATSLPRKVSLARSPLLLWTVPLSQWPSPHSLSNHFPLPLRTNLRVETLQTLSTWPCTDELATLPILQLPL